MNLTELKELTAAQDEAQRAAAESVRGAHSAALQAAQELRDELAQAQAEGDEREALKGIIEAAAGKVFPSKAGREMAGVVIGQFQAAVADSPAPASVSRNGSELVARCANAAQGYSDDQRRQVFAAIVLACLDKSVKTGLLSFPAEWAHLPSMDGMRQMARTLDADSVAALEAEHVARAAELAEAQKFVDGLKQARPALWVLDAEAEPEITICNRRGGSSGFGGVTFQPGDNVLTDEQFAAVRNHPGYLAGIEAGTLAVVETASLVQEA